MFDFSLSELMIIMVVALVVIGPERLPKVARTLGHLWGRAQRYINGVKADIARDMAVEEFKQLQKQVQEEADKATQSVQQASGAARQDFEAIEQEFNSLTEPAHGGPGGSADPADTGNSDPAKRSA